MPYFTFRIYRDFFLSGKKNNVGFEYGNVNFYGWF